MHKLIVRFDRDDHLQQPPKIRLNVVRGSISVAQASIRGIEWDRKVIVPQQEASPVGFAKIKRASRESRTKVAKYDRCKIQVS